MCRLLVLTIVILSLASPLPAITTGTSWVFSPDQLGDWSVASNWDGGVPTSNIDAYIDNGGTATISELGAACFGLIVGDSRGSGTIQVTAGGLAVAGAAYVGTSGTGAFTQTGGSTSIHSHLYLGYDATGSGTYSLGGDGTLALDSSEYVGYSGTGAFSQSGGSNSLEYLYVGYNGGSGGTYVQSSGSNAVSQTLYLGYNAGSSGTYTLRAGQLSVSRYGTQVGYTGVGTFIQSGGTVTSASNLTIGNQSGSNGTYDLSGDGVVTITGKAGALNLGYHSGTSGTCRMSGSSQLSASAEYVGRDPGATALFEQSGGTNTTKLLSIGTGGQYRLSGGTLQINGGVLNNGSFDGGTSPATISGANCILDFSTGVWTNMSATSVSMGANSLTILPVGFALGSYTSSGLTHTVGTALVVPAGQGFGGYGSINDPVTCQGTITAATDGFINLNNGLILSNSGSVTLVGGNLTVNDAVSGMDSGQLSRMNQYVGKDGVGAFTQTGGKNIATEGGELYLGYNAGDSGTYTLSGNGQLSGTTHVGHSGTGHFVQSGGTNTGALCLGYNAGSHGTYALSNTGRWSYDGDLHVGYSGTGDFNQTGGSISTSVTSGTLYLGYNLGASGSYTLSDGTVSWSGDRRSEHVGHSGTGSFRQSGGSNTTSLYLGYNAGSSGTYDLSGGTLSGTRWVGYSGTGTLTHSGGTSTGGALILAYDAGSNGTYCLSGTGQLSAAYQFIGYDADATALFQQTGGSNTATYLVIGPSGRYQLHGGVLTVSGGGLVNQGALDGGNAPATLSVGSGCIVDLSTGALANVGALSVNVAANSLLTLPSAFGPLTGFGSYTSAGITHTAGTTVVVPAGKGFGGWGTVNDLVDCRGAITVASGYYSIEGVNPVYAFINLTKGLIVSESGAVNLGQGFLTVNDAVSGIGGGSLTVYKQYVGDGGAGTFTQTGGTNTISHTINSQNSGWLYLGYGAGDHGSYSLSGSGQLSVAVLTGGESVGYSGVGFFGQSGGTNTCNSLVLGANAGSSGTYLLSGTGRLCGTSQPFRVTVGDSGNGTFIQSGGSNTTVSSNYHGYLYLGEDVDGCGTYNLLDGEVTFNYEEVGYYGTGTFTQSGGTNTVKKRVSYLKDGVLYIGAASGANGTYNLTGGSLSAAIEYVGNSGTGIFNQSGGTHTVSSLYLGYLGGSSGTYSFDGGTLILSSLSGGDGTAAFNFGGGTVRASKTFTTTIPFRLTGEGGDANVDTVDYAVVLSGALSGEGGLNKFGLGTLTLGGANTYTGDTTVHDGLLALTDSGSLLLDINTTGASTSILGDGAINLDGTLVFNLTDVSSQGNWHAVTVDTLTETFGEDFGVEILVNADSFAAMETAPGVWACDVPSRGLVIFTEATGVLSVVPEPGSLSLLFMGLFGLLAHGWRRKHEA